jgi:hypothetical protein
MSGDQFIAALIAIAGFVAFCALIAWFVGRVLDYAGKIFDDRNREFADADCFVCGDIPALHEELTGGRNLLSVPGGQGTTELPTTRRTHNNTQLRLPSTPPSCGR